MFFAIIVSIFTKVVIFFVIVEIMFAEIVSIFTIIETFFAKIKRKGGKLSSSAFSHLCVNLIFTI